MGRHLTDETTGLPSMRRMMQYFKSTPSTRGDALLIHTIFRAAATVI